jgi:hypothetical protein
MAAVYSQFYMHVVQKLFEKCGGATLSEVLPVRAIKTLISGLLEDTQGGIFLM